MAEKLEDFNLPNTVVQKIIKEGLAENLNIGKDARTALARAASVFILYVTSHASQIAQKGNRKTLLGQDVIEALESLEFQELVNPLQSCLIDYKDSKKKVIKPKLPADEEDEGIENPEDDDED